MAIKDNPEKKKKKKQFKVPLVSLLFFKFWNFATGRFHRHIQQEANAASPMLLVLQPLRPAQVVDCLVGNSAVKDILSSVFMCIYIYTYYMSMYV